ncbi:phiSA1p31-related protein [Streptomyces sp. NPDC051130]|uniref:phiSA1p31-related protein n=1 Tax=Streptomyces sp. NPDC051130 TaxID=3157223 RepID=UPI003423D1C5
MTAFKVGDEVTLSTRAGSRAVVEYGPYGTNGDVYLVKLLEGEDTPDVFSALAHIMKAAPVVFAPGDRVAGFGGTEFSIVAGPFTAHDTWYVVEDASGKHHPYGDSSITLVSRAPQDPSDTYAHDGVTYDLTAKYRDKDGDIWEFSSGSRADDGSPSGVMNDGEVRESLARVVLDYRPLTKI